MMVAGNMVVSVTRVDHVMIRKLLLILVILLSVSGCSGEEPFRTDSYALPEEASLEVREVFLTSEPVRGAFFSSIRGIHLLEDGHLIVWNRSDPRLYELNGDGEPIQVIGREGRGPGEFLNIDKVLLSPGDSLHTFDNQSMRHQIWAKSEDGKWTVARERIGKRGSFFDYLKRKVPERLETDLDQTLYGVFRMNPLTYDTLMNFNHYIAPVDHNLEPVGEISRMKRTEDVIINSSGILSMNPRFFRAFYFYYPRGDEVIYIRNTSNEIFGIDAGGEEKVKGYLPFERFPRREEAEQRLREFVHRADSLNLPIAPDYVEIRLERMLPHEPYYWNVFSDGKYLWVHLARSDTTKPNWLITRPDGEVLGSFRGPPLEQSSIFQRIAVQGNRLYGQTTGPDGTVYLAGYEVVGLDQVVSNRSREKAGAEGGDGLFPSARRQQ